MQQVNSGVAYLLWCLCFFGVCGGQRFYTGHMTSGLVYLFTFGFLGVGQLIDLAFIPSMVNRRNIYLRGLHAQQSLELNIGNIPRQQKFQANASPSTAHSPMQKLLLAAKKNGGQLSIAQAAMYTGLDPKEAKKLLQEAEKVGCAEICNDPVTGAIRYRFDV